MYVQETLTSGERLVHIGRFHWYYNIGAILNIIWGVIFAALIIIGAIMVGMYTQIPVGTHIYKHDSWWVMVNKLHPAIRIFALLMFITGLFKFAHMMIIRLTTEIAVTSRRVIYKHGLVARFVGEISIDRIESVNVFQSVLGRLFDFGSVIIHGMGVGQVYLPPIRNPLKFRKAIEYARTIGEENTKK
jgi:uncharacterized membrane protein YdbT with pleckstrin-like domain